MSNSFASTGPLPPPNAIQQRSSKLGHQDRSHPSSNGGHWPPALQNSNDPTPSTAAAPPGQNNGTGYKLTPPPTSGKRDTPKSRKLTDGWKVSEDVRARLPALLRRFSGYRDPKSGPPYEPLPFPPFSWLKYLSLKHETWILSTIGSFVGIALIEIVNAAGFPNEGTILIVASFGASAVLSFASIESPLAQPRHLVGGQVLSAILAVCLTRLFRLASAYQLDDTTQSGELNHVVWLNGALSMALSLLLMQITGTVHPPGGATAIIASVQPAAVAMSWRLIYNVLISSLVMLGWAMIINNVGRRRWPTYWFSGSMVFVRKAGSEETEETTDEMEMAIEEGRSARGFGGSTVPTQGFTDAAARDTTRLPSASNG